jgi:hypothetical protein
VRTHRILLVLGAIGVCSSLLMLLLGGVGFAAPIQMLVGSLSLLLLVSAAVLGIVAERREQALAWRRIARERRRLVERREDLRLSVNRCSEDLVRTPHEAAIILGIARIESEADKVLGVNPEEAPRGPFDIRSQLKDRGLWTEADVRDFDSLMRLRNSLVHGSDSRLSSREMQDHLSSLSRLLRLISAEADAGYGR